MYTFIDVGRAAKCKLPRTPTDLVMSVTRVVINFILLQIYNFRKRANVDQMFIYLFFLFRLK